MDKCPRFALENYDAPPNFTLMDYSFIEGFCGPGGMSLGLKDAGFEPLFAFDIDAASVQTHRRNLGPNCRELERRADFLYFPLPRVRFRFS